MKRYFPALLFVLLASSGCSDFSAYRYHHTYAMTAPMNHYNREHRTTDLVFRFEINEKKIFTYITNISNDDIGILWSKVRFIDSRGGNHNVFNLKTLFTKNKKIEDETIAPGKTDENVIVPKGHVVKLEDQWTWRVKPFYNQRDDRAMLNKKKKFSIILPVMVRGDEERKYRFDFMVASVLPYRSQNPQ